MESERSSGVSFKPQDTTGSFVLLKEERNRANYGHHFSMEQDISHPSSLTHLLSKGPLSIDSFFIGNLNLQYWYNMSERLICASNKWDHMLPSLPVIILLRTFLEAQSICQCPITTDLYISLSVLPCAF